MKKTVSFAAALIIAAGCMNGAFAQTAFAEDEITTDEVMSVSYDAYTPTKLTEELMNGLEYKPRLVALLKDGTELTLTSTAEKKQDRSTIDLIGSVTKAELTSTLKKKGKTLSDVDNFMCYVKINYKGAKSFGSYNATFAYGANVDVKVGGHRFSGSRLAYPKDFIVTPLELKEYRLDKNDGDKGIHTVYFSEKYKSNDMETVKLSEVDEFLFDIRLEFNTKESKTIMGDANGDKKIDVADIAVAATHIKGIKALTSEQIKAADVNKDNNVNVADIAMIASHIKGIKALK